LKLKYDEPTSHIAFNCNVCRYTKARTCAGLRDVSTCVVKQNREITPGVCKKETNLLVHLAGTSPLLRDCLLIALEMRSNVHSQHSL
jgi:hypothetical protein